MPRNSRDFDDSRQSRETIGGDLWRRRLLSRLYETDIGPMMKSGGAGAHGIDRSGVDGTAAPAVSDHGRPGDFIGAWDRLDRKRYVRKQALLLAGECARRSANMTHAVHLIILGSLAAGSFLAVMALPGDGNGHSAVQMAQLHDAAPRALALEPLDTVSSILTPARALRYAVEPAGAGASDVPAAIRLPSEARPVAVAHQRPAPSRTLVRTEAAANVPPSSAPVVATRGPVPAGSKPAAPFEPPMALGLRVSAAAPQIGGHNPEANQGTADQSRERGLAWSPFEINR